MYCTYTVHMISLYMQYYQYVHSTCTGTGVPDGAVDGAVRKPATVPASYVLPSPSPGQYQQRATPSTTVQQSLFKFSIQFVCGMHGYITAYYIQTNLKMYIHMYQQCSTSTIIHLHYTCTTCSTLALYTRTLALCTCTVHVLQVLCTSSTTCTPHIYTY